MAPDEFKTRCLTLLKAMGKTLSQLSLYALRHPNVKQSISEDYQALEFLLLEAQGEFILSLDKDAVLINGQIVAHPDQISKTLVEALLRFELHGVTFLAGVTRADLAVFYEALSAKADAFRAGELEKYLRERGVTQIRPNASMYVKVEKKDEDEASVMVPGAGEAATAAPEEAGPDALDRDLEKLTLEQAVEKLARQASPDPAEQARLSEILKRKLREDIEKRVAEATALLRREKTALSNEKTRTDVVLNTMSQAVVLVDDNGDVLLMNTAAESLYGKSLGDMAGKPLITAGRPAEHVVTLAEDIRTPSDRPIARHVVNWGHPETVRALKAAAAVVRNEQGSVVGFVAGLPEAAKFRELQRVQDEFVAQVTHELRSPLTSITAALSLMRQQSAGKLGPDEARTLAVASRNAERLGSLINDILDFSKLEAGQMTVHLRALDVGPALSEAALSLEPWAETKGLKLHVSAAGGLPQAAADPKRFTQIVVNLVSNAIKFSPSGSAIDVTARLDPEEPGFIRCAVTDHGHGMSPEDTARLFEKFVQLMSGEKQAAGTGLGLSITKALVHLQNGRIWVQSAPGAGSTFYFTLPEYHPEPDEDTPAAARPWWKRLLRLK